MRKNSEGSAPRACLGLHSISCPRSTCLNGWRSLSGKVTHSAQFRQLFQSRQKCMRPLKAWMGGTSLVVQWLRLRLPWEVGSGWGTHVNPWLIHVNVWQKPLQCCKVISLQIIKINEKKKKKKKTAFQCRGRLQALIWELRSHVPSG